MLGRVLWDATPLAGGPKRCARSRCICWLWIQAPRQPPCLHTSATNPSTSGCLQPQQAEAEMLRAQQADLRARIAELELMLPNDNGEFKGLRQELQELEKVGCADTDQSVVSDMYSLQGKIFTSLPQPAPSSASRTYTAGSTGC